MKTISKSTMTMRSTVLLAICTFITIMILTIGSSKASNGTGKDKTGILTLKTAGITTTEAIAKATRNGNAVFLIITDSAKTDFDKAKTIADAANASVKKSVVITMNRDDKSNAALVTKYNIAMAPLPLLAVISPKGILAGGFLLSQTTAEILIKAIPSPKQDEVLAAISDKKSVFIVAAKSLFADKAKAVAACDSAVTLNADKSVMVEINISDAKETAFLGILKVSIATTTAATVVVNSKGQITGTFYDTQKAADLVTLSNKVLSGCCPSSVNSSSKSCAPKK